MSSQYAKLGEHPHSLVAGRVVLCDARSQWTEQGLQGLVSYLHGRMKGFEGLTLAGVEDLTDWEPLCGFLSWWNAKQWPWQLHARTSLLNESNWELWRESFRSIVLCVDSSMNSVACSNMVQRVNNMQHRRISMEVEIDEDNVESMQNIYALASSVHSMSHVRFVVKRGVAWNDSFRNAYMLQLARLHGLRVTCVCEPEPDQFRLKLENEEAASIPCRAGHLFFCLYPSGAYLPCPFIPEDAKLPYLCNRVCDSVGKFIGEQMTDAYLSRAPHRAYNGNFPVCSASCQPAMYQLNCDIEREADCTRYVI